jgi:hypothetical protein
MAWGRGVSSKLTIHHCCNGEFGTAIEQHIRAFYTHYCATYLVSPVPLRCGSHNLAVATKRWNVCIWVQRVCPKCTADEVDDEFHVIPRCSGYEGLRQSMHARYNVLACVGGIHRAHMAGDEGMSECLNQTPRHVARFVSECMHVRETKPDPPPGTFCRVPCRSVLL